MEMGSKPVTTAVTFGICAFAHRDARGARTNSYGVHTESGCGHTESAGVHTESAGVHTESGGVHTESNGVYTESYGVHTESYGAHTKSNCAHAESYGVYVESCGAHKESYGAEINSDAAHMDSNEAHSESNVEVSECRRANSECRGCIRKLRTMIAVHWFLLAAYVILLPSNLVSGMRMELEDFINTTETDIMDHMLKGYDPRLRPDYNTGKPTKIECNMYIRGISEINQISMQYNMDILFRQKWRDPRVRYDRVLNGSGINYTYLNVYNYSALWNADLYFKNAREAHYHDVIKEQKLLRVFPDGRILYSIRVSLKLECHMHLHKYPFDSQKCDLKIGSFSQTTAHLVIAWQAEKPVTKAKNLTLPEFVVKEVRCEEVIKSFSTGSYSNLAVNLRFDRESGFYMISVYIPSIMIVVVSWVSFWLDVEAGPARVSLAITTFLTMHTMSSSIRSTLPAVSYTKAIDVWTGVCTAFIFGALLEYALANYMARRCMLKKRKQQDQHFMLVPSFMKLDENDDPWSGMTNCDVGASSPGSAKGSDVSKRTVRSSRVKDFSPKLGLPSKSAKAVDVLARILFPSSFFIFNIAYWIYYLALAEQPYIAGKLVA